MSHRSRRGSEHGKGRGLSRREFLGAVRSRRPGAFGAGGVLAACGSSSTRRLRHLPRRPSGSPKRGGNLRVGLTGGATSDTLYPLAQVTIPDLARSPQLFNSLIQFQSNGQLALVLAEEMTPNSNATEWTIKLKEGITFHNGKPLTADDVIFTFQQCLNPKAPAPSAAAPRPGRARWHQEARLSHGQDPVQDPVLGPSADDPELQPADNAGRLRQVQPSRNRPVHVQVVHSWRGEPLRPEPELLRGGPALCRLRADHRLSGRDEHDQRAPRRTRRMRSAGSRSLRSPP